MQEFWDYDAADHEKARRLSDEYLKRRLQELKDGIGYLPGFTGAFKLDDLLATMDANQDGVVDMREWRERLPDEAKVQLKQWLTKKDDLPPAFGFRVLVT